MIKRVRTTKEITFIYQYGEGVKTAEHVNIKKKLEGYTLTDFEKATKETKGHYVLVKKEEETINLINAAQDAKSN